VAFRLYARRSKKVGPFRVNLTKRGLGLSVGVPGARWSVHTTGRSTKTVGVPGTGIYWREQKASPAHAATPRRPAPATAHRKVIARPDLPPPGWRADPTRRFEWRWWTGTAWSGHVASNGVQKVDRTFGQLRAP
jgi:hypothetical protein